MAKRVGVLLSGCGYLDGSEIHEATLTLYFLDKAGAKIIALAPNKAQADVVDHNKHTPVDETRNVMTEAGRIARGHVKDVARVTASELDALIIPGGFGAAKNLCSFAVDGPDCSVDPGVEKLVKDLHAAHKPIGALCIAPAVLARILGADHGVELTIGTDAATARALEEMGAKHTDCRVDGVVVDKRNRLLSTPCYMLGGGPAEVGAGIEELVGTLMDWLG